MGYTPIEYNASDVRSKKAVKEMAGVRDNKSITEMFSNSKDEKKEEIKGKTCIIMDEIDGMSTGKKFYLIFI